MNDLLSNLSREELIEVIATMHDTINDWSNGWGFSSDWSVILNKVGDASLEYSKKRWVDLHNVNQNIVIPAHKNELLEKLSNEDLIIVIANMYDAIQDFSKGWELGDADITTLNNVGNASLNYTNISHYNSKTLPKY